MKKIIIQNKKQVTIFEGKKVRRGWNEKKSCGIFQSLIL